MIPFYAPYTEARQSDPRTPTHSAETLQKPRAYCRQRLKSAELKILSPKPRKPNRRITVELHPRCCGRGPHSRVCPGHRGPPLDFWVYGLRVDVPSLGFRVSGTRDRTTPKLSSNKTRTTKKQEIPKQPILETLSTQKATTYSILLKSPSKQPQCPQTLHPTPVFSMQ